MSSTGIRSTGHFGLGEARKNVEQNFSACPCLGIDRSDAEDHLASLAAAATRALTGGKPREAFYLSDRLCRLRPAKARDLLLRFLSLTELGKDEAARASLRQAQRADGQDLLVARASLLRRDGVSATETAAEALLNSPRASRADVEIAVRHKLAIPEPLVIQAWRRGSLVVGRVSWVTGDIPTLGWRGDVTWREIELVGGRSGADGICRASFTYPCDPAEGGVLEASSVGGSVSAAMYAVATPEWPPRNWLSPAAKSPVVSVIVPVYKDINVTRQCLDALASQAADFAWRCVVVDDCIAEADLAEFVVGFSERFGAELIVNRVNLGFAGSVNKAISRCPPGDVLLLNSDVILGEDSLARLNRIAHSACDIGTVAPLSNDGGPTSFPVHAAGNPLLPAVERRRIDGVARTVHENRVVDVHTNIGFCLYVRGDCLLDVGFLSQSYGRGYFEDVEFCLNAAEKGYRNVAAPGIYVGHASGRSFLDEKPKLVSRNFAIVQSRFEGFRSSSDAAVDADPLREARIALEEHLPPSGPVTLRVVRNVAARAQDPPSAIESAPDAMVLHMLWIRVGRKVAVSLKAADGSPPQSLTFTLDESGSSRLTAYLATLKIATIEIEEIAALPSYLADILAKHAAPVVIKVANRDCAMAVRRLGDARASEQRVPGPSPSFPPFPSARIDAVDEMARAFLTRPPRAAQSDGRGSDRRWVSSLRRVGAWAPVPVAAVDLLIHRLSACMASQPEFGLVVFGACVDDLQAMRLGNVHVTGPVSVAEAEEVFALYDVDAIVSPYRTSMFGDFAAATAASARPKAYFDWSEGLVPGRPVDLVIDWRTTLDSVCVEFRAWCNAIHTQPLAHLGDRAQ